MDACSSPKYARVSDITSSLTLLILITLRLTSTLYSFQPQSLVFAHRQSVPQTPSCRQRRVTVSVLSSISALRFVFTASRVCNWLTAGKLIFTVKPSSSRRALMRPAIFSVAYRAVPRKPVSIPLTIFSSSGRNCASASRCRLVTVDSICVISSRASLRSLNFISGLSGSKSRILSC